MVMAWVTRWVRLLCCAVLLQGRCEDDIFDVLGTH